MEKYSQFYSKAEQADIVAAIEMAESKTSGEIRVHLEDHCDHLPKDRAAFIFQRLKMHQTQDRNGVLFYLSICDHDFAVIGDEGIHVKVGEEYWREICQKLETEFRAGRFKEGLINAIGLIGDELAQYFPRSSGDINELTDEISMGEV